MYRRKKSEQRQLEKNAAVTQVKPTTAIADTDDVEVLVPNAAAAMTSQGSDQKTEWKHGVAMGAAVRCNVIRKLNGNTCNRFPRSIVLTKA